MNTLKFWFILSALVCVFNFNKSYYLNDEQKDWDLAFNKCEKIEGKYQNIVCDGDDGIYYLDNNKQSWERSRQLCSQKFNGSPFADLISLDSDKRRENLEKLMAKNTQITQVATNGVCCQRRAGKTRFVCEWLSPTIGNGTIENDFVNNSSSPCLMVMFNKNKLKFETASIDGTLHPWICLYRKPIINETKPTTAPVSSTSPTVPSSTSSSTPSSTIPSSTSIATVPSSTSSTTSSPTITSSTSSPSTNPTPTTPISSTSSSNPSPTTPFLTTQSPTTFSPQTTTSDEDSSTTSFPLTSSTTTSPSSTPISNSSSTQKPPKECLGGSVTIYNQIIILDKEQANKKILNCEKIYQLSTKNISLEGHVKLKCDGGKVEVVEDRCYQKWMEDFQEKVEKIENISETYKLGAKFKENISSENNIKNSMEINKALNIIETLQNKFDNYSKNSQDSGLVNFTNNIFNSYSGLISKENAWQTANGTEKINTASKILRMSKSSGFSFGCLIPNVSSDILTQTVNTDNLIVNTYATNNSVLNNPIIFKNESNFPEIIVPEGVNFIHNNQCKNSLAIGEIYSKLHEYFTQAFGENQSHWSINSHVISFSFDKGDEKRNLPENKLIKIRWTHEALKFGDKIYCSYWNFTTKEWNFDGCWLSKSESNRHRSVCYCDHLTNFAAIMDVEGREGKSTAKDILTIICCSLSIIGLSITICLLALVRSLRDRRSKITVNLCICLLLVNLLIVFGMDRTENLIVCDIISLVLFYCLLASFFWTLMEGYHLYQMVVLVFNNIGHIPMVYVYLIGYGPPVLLVIAFIVTEVITKSPPKFSGDYFCWISSGKNPLRILFLVVPATLIILVNMFILVKALRAAFLHKMKRNDNSGINSNVNQNQSTGSRFAWIKGFGLLVVLLGSTWLLYILYIHEYCNFLSYIFIFTNGLQGFFIFLFQIVFNEKARNYVVKMYSRKRPRFMSSYKTSSSNPFTFNTSVSPVGSSQGTIMNNNRINSTKQKEIENDVKNIVNLNSLKRKPAKVDNIYSFT